MVNSIKKSLKRAFTITELVIVIAVIAILAAVLIPTFSNVVSSANKSAALSTCHNALTDLMGVYANNGDTTEDMDGMVFVSDGYAYVLLNSALQYVGELDDLAGVGSDGKTIKATVTSQNDTYVANYSDSDGHDSASLVIEADKTYSTFTWGSAISLSSLSALSERLYVYSVSDNGTTYYGFFTYETGTATYQTEGATYSRLYGYDHIAISTSSTLTCFAESN